MSEDSEDQIRLDVDIQAEVLEEIVKPAINIAADGLTNFRWGSDGLRIGTVDAADAIAINQTIQPAAFENYEVQSEANEIVFGTRCNTISHLLRAARSDDIVNLILKQQSHRMEIQFSDVSYALSGVDPEAVNEPHIPDLEFDIEATVHSRVFQRSHQVIGMMSETIIFDISQDIFQISGRGDTDVAEINVALEENEESILERDRKCAAVIETVNKPAESKYGSEFIDYLYQFTPSGCVAFYISEDHPLKVVAEQEDGAVLTEIIIAPRMDSS